MFLHDNCEQISFIIFFAFLKKEEMRCGTHFTQQNVLLLFTVVVTKHVWPYFQSHFPKTSSERVSSSSSVLWLLVILVVPGPQLLADLHVRTDILGIQLISSIIAGWPVKEVVLASGAGRILEPKPTPPSIKNNRARSTSDIGSDVQPLSLFQFSSVTVCP